MFREEQKRIGVLWIVVVRQCGRTSKSACVWSAGVGNNIAQPVGRGKTLSIFLVETSRLSAADLAHPVPSLFSHPKRIFITDDRHDVGCRRDAQRPHARAHAQRASALHAYSGAQRLSRCGPAPSPSARAGALFNGAASNRRPSPGQRPPCCGLSALVPSVFCLCAQAAASALFVSHSIGAGGGRWERTDTISASVEALDAASANPQHVVGPLPTPASIQPSVLCRFARRRSSGGTAMRMRSSSWSASRRAGGPRPSTGTRRTGRCRCCRNTSLTRSGAGLRFMLSPLL